MFKKNNGLSYFHPVIISFVPVLYLGGQNLKEVPLKLVILGCLMAGGLSCALWGVLSIRSSFKEASVPLTLMITLTFLFGPFLDLTYLTGLNDKYIFNLVLTVYGILSIIILYKYLATPKSFMVLQPFVCVFAITLCLINLFQIALSPELHVKIKRNLNKTEEKGVQKTYINGLNPIVKDNQNITPVYPKTELPSIFYIILDGYARGNVLQEYLSYDNSDFENFLSNKGFYIADYSNSNYPLTHFSLASSLNLKYINDVVEMAKESLSDFSLFHLIQDSEVARFLKGHGYKYVTFSSGWGPTSGPSPLSDVHYGSRINDIPPFFKMIAKSTPLRPFFENTEAKLRVDTLKGLGRISYEKGRPSFVFCHLVMPHTPYYFDEKGEYIYKPSQDDYDKNLYVGQLKYLNESLKKTIQDILSSHEITPIIILQADHGSWFSLQSYTKGMPTPSQIGERFGILNAYLVPDNLRKELYPTISPVNSFRVLLNGLFNAKYPLLEDKNYFQWYFESGELNEVTNTVSQQVKWFSNRSIKSTNFEGNFS